MIVSHYIVVADLDQSFPGLILRYRKDCDYEEFYY